MTWRQLTWFVPMDKTLLIVSFFFPPCQRSGSQRAMKLAKFLPEHGWKPIIVAADSPRSIRWDESALKEFESVTIYRARGFRPVISRNSLLSRIVAKIWRLITVIDEEVLWARSAYKACLEVLDQHKVDALFITGYPFSSFAVGYLIKKRTGIPFFIDYRDPWLSNPSFTRGRWKTILEVFERACLKKCNLFFGASEAIVRVTGADLADSLKSKGRTFTYSFDPTEFPTAVGSTSEVSDVTRLLSAGSAYDAVTGSNLLLAFETLSNTGVLGPHNVSFCSYGDLKVSHPIPRQLDEIVDLKTFVPRTEVLRRMADSHGLILAHGAGGVVPFCYPGRMFEYFAFRKPILYLGAEDGVAADCIRESGLGIVADSGNASRVQEKLVEFLTKVNTRSFTPNEDFLTRFESRNIIGEFVSEVEASLSLTADR